MFGGGRAVVVVVVGVCGVVVGVGAEVGGVAVVVLGWWPGRGVVVGGVCYASGEVLVVVTAGRIPVGEVYVGIVYAKLLSLGVVMGRFRIWTKAERREALAGVERGSVGFARALVGSIGGAVSSCLLAAADSLEEEILEGDMEGAALSLEHVRALWRLGSECAEFDAEEVAAKYLSESERESAELVETMAECLSFVWVDASRRWIMLPPGVSESESVARFLSAYRRGEVPVVESSWLTPAERSRRRGAGGVSSVE